MHLFLTILGWIGAYYGIGIVCMVAAMFLIPKDAPEGAGLGLMLVGGFWPIFFPVVLVARFWPDPKSGKPLDSVERNAPAGPPRGGSPWG